jgi:hypothetical protein
MQVARVAPDWPVPNLGHRRRVLGDRITYIEIDVRKEGIVVAVAEGGPGKAGGAAAVRRTLATTICRIADPTHVARPR